MTIICMLSLLCTSKENKIEHYYIKGKVKNMKTATGQLKTVFNEDSVMLPLPLWLITFPLLILPLTVW